MKMTPRPSSPTSLLWAHQVKREHGYLLSRMQQLESANQQHDDRLKKAEASAKASTNNDISALAEQVKAIDESGITKRLENVEKDVMAKLDDVQAESEAMAMKVATLERDDALVEEERRKAFNKEKTLLKRVAEVEANLKLYQESLEHVGRRVDDASVGVIRAQLDGLAKQVRKEGEGMKRLEDSIGVLETANEELRKANERMAKEIAEVAAARPRSAPAVQTVVPKKAAEPKAAPPPKAAAARSQPPSESDDTPRTRKKKSHKWAGGGADRDIILQGSDLTQKTPAGPARRILTPKGVARPKDVAKAKGVARPKEVAKSKEVVKPKEVAKPKEVTKPSRKSQAFLDDDADKPIIRAGKGWIEVAVTPGASEQESQESNASVKRPRGRPRKHPRPDTLEELGQDAQRLTRGGRQQLTQNKTVPQKRKAETEAPPTAGHSRLKPSGATKQAKAAQTYGSAHANTALQVLSSPFSSPAPSLDGTPGLGRSKNALLEAVTSQPEQPQAKRRRVIEQPDDGALLQQYR
ncbi:hypothetical protein LTR36_003064 [Oleoguttula mirabilis]|uniref:Uncharacterized protein n=1 Tax=Oleoguttula mirabilis TaxID=1507867 RepID=A0AAV9JWG8_9PEZI|nr:hypothetical protein LTR36_003064 [Oleoguttula mirabilis]